MSKQKRTTKIEIFIMIFLIFLFSGTIVGLNLISNNKQELKDIIETHEQFSAISEKHKTLNTYIAICTENYSQNYILNNYLYFPCILDSLTNFVQNEEKEFHSKTISDFYDIVLKQRKSIMAD